MRRGPKPKADPDIDPAVKPVLERLKAVWEESGLTREQLAERAGISPSTWSGWHNGSRDPQMPELAKCALALNHRLDVVPLGTSAAAVAAVPIFDWAESAEVAGLVDAVPDRAAREYILKRVEKLAMQFAKGLIRSDEPKDPDS